MRVLLGLLLSTTVAAAQPAQPPPPAPPVIHIEPLHFNFGSGAKTFPGFGGTTVFGMIRIPDRHPDEQLWPKGMLFAPPDIGDDNAIIPGTNSLPWFRTPRRLPPLSQRLSETLQRGVGAVIDLIVPPTL